MKVNYSQDNVKAIANTVSEIMEKDIKKIESLDLFCNILFKDNLRMHINNDFGKIKRISFFCSKQYVHNYSVVLECKPFQIQGQIWKKMNDEYFYLTTSLVPFTKNLYLNDSSISKLERPEDKIINSLHFRVNSGTRYNYDMYPIDKNLINSKIDDECLHKVEELANYLYMLKKKYRFHDCNFEEIIKSLLLQYKLDMEIEESFKRIFKENKDKILTLSNKNNLK